MSLILPNRRTRRVPFGYAVKALGLSSNLKLCLDAGDSASYTSGTKWLDTSGNGYDFDITGATFTGTAGGLSRGEYWALDGGDFFTYDSANEAWMENIHKDNAKFTILVWAYISSSGVTRALIGDTGTNNQGASTGFYLTVTSLDDLWLVVHRSNASQTLLIDDDTAPAVGAWSLFGVSLDEAAGTALLQQNSSFSSETGTYSSPSASGASQTLQIAARGAGASPSIMPNGDRMGGVMAWEGVALTQAQMTAVFNATRSRFGV